MQAKSSLDGILRQDDVELQYTSPNAKTYDNNAVPSPDSAVLRGDAEQLPVRTFGAGRQSKQYAKM